MFHFMQQQIRRQTMDIEKLKLFISLAETLSFNRTSELCHVSPSTLSRTIQQLEAQLNNRLFERDNRTVTLTHQGNTFLGFARDIVQQWETAQESMQADANKLKGSLSIYCSVTASYSFLFDMLKNFRAHQPDIEIKLHTGDPALALERVISGNEDMAIAAQTPNMPKDVCFKRFTASELIFIGPSGSEAFFREEKEHEKDYLQRLPLIVSERGLARQRLDSWYKSNAIKPNIYAQVSGNEAIVSMVSLGLGVGLLPKIVLDNSPLASKVKPFTGLPNLGAFNVGLCVLEKRLRSPIIDAFWSQIKSN